MPADVVYKYELRPGAEGLELPRGARVLSTAAQGESVMIWAVVTGRQTAVEFREIRAFATGQAINHVDPDREIEFIGTVLLGAFVFHVFDMAPPAPSPEER